MLTLFVGFSSLDIQDEPKKEKTSKNFTEEKTCQVADPKSAP